MKHFPRILLVCFLIPMLATACSSTNASTNNDVSLGEEKTAKLESYSHSSDTDPDYEIVFPDDEVNKIIISISSENWEAVFDDMTDNYGEFGGSDRTSDGQPAGGGGPGGQRGDMAQRENIDGEPPELTEDGPQMGNPPEAMPEMATPSVDEETDQEVIEEEQADAQSDETITAPVGPGNGGEKPQMDRGGMGGGQPGGGGGGGGMGGGMMDGQDDENPIWVDATIEFEGETWEHVGFRLKGNSSLKSSWNSGNNKLPFKLDFDEFEDEYEEIENQRFYGFKQLSFSSNFSDSSYLREKISADIFRDAGVPSAQTAFYAVYVDYGEGPVYFGMYTAVEVVDDTVIQTQFEDDSGNVYKPSGSAATFAEGSYNEEQYDKETNKKEDDYSDLESLLEALHSDLRTSDAEAWRGELENVLDVDTFLKWLSANTVMQNWDTYGSMSHNYYLYHDPTSDQLVWIPWDNNQSMNGNTGGGGGDRGTNIARAVDDDAAAATENNDEDQKTMEDPGARAENAGGGRNTMGRGSSSIGHEETGENWPLISYLLADEVYKQQYDEYVEDFISDVFNPDTLEPVITEAHELIASYVEAEQEGYTTLSNIDAFNTSVDSLLEHIASRYNTALEYLAEAE